jgi:hypothetical protein
VNTIRSFDGSALDYLKVLDRCPSVAEYLQTEEVTLFAPVNKNFEAAVKYLNMERAKQGDGPIYLADVDQGELEHMLCKYVLTGNRTTDAYENERDGLLLPSIIYAYPMHVKYVKLSSSGYVSGGASSLNFSNPFGSVFIDDWITTTANAVNIRTNNATINILTPIHNFGFDEFTLRLND